MGGMSCREAAGSRMQDQDGVYGSHKIHDPHCVSISVTSLHHLVHCASGLSGCADNQRVILMKRCSGASHGNDTVMAHEWHGLCMYCISTV